MAVVTLTDTFVQELPLAGKHEKQRQFIYWDAACAAFGVRVGRRRKTFVVHIKNNRIAIGHWPQLSLAAARLTARLLLDEAKRAAQALKPDIRTKVIASVEKSMPKKPEAFDATKGHYFVVELPDKQWAVFWQHPSQGDWHRQIAKFQDRMRAEAYVVQETQALSPAFANPDLMAGPPAETEPQVPRAAPVYPLYQPPKPPVADQVQALAKRIAKRLPELYAAHPGGVPAQLVVDTFGVAYPDTLAALRYLGQQGIAQWVGIGKKDDRRKFLFPKDATLPAAELSSLQQTVFDVIKYAMVDGQAELSHKAIARRGEASAASVPAVVDTLRRKKLIHLIRRGTHAGTQSPVYGLGPAPPELETEPDHWITFDDLLAAKASGA